MRATMMVARIVETHSRDVHFTRTNDQVHFSKPCRRSSSPRTARVDIDDRKLLVDQLLFFVLWCAPKVATT
jgi:hypothetical protein